MYANMKVIMLRYAFTNRIGWFLFHEQHFTYKALGDRSLELPWVATMRVYRDFGSSRNFSDRKEKLEHKKTFFGFACKCQKLTRSFFAISVPTFGDRNNKLLIVQTSRLTLLPRSLKMISTSRIGPNC
jgi:hypothetical protein